MGELSTLGAVIVIAKEPVPGRVKTRLVPPLTPVEAADLAAAAIRDTLAASIAVPAAVHLLALDGHPGAWLPGGWSIVAQPSGGLDARLVAAFESAASAAGPAILIGMDTPQVAPHQIAAFDPLHYDAALGLAPDGGYWAIGLRDPMRAREVISGVPMSSDQTGRVQLARLRAAGMRVQLLDSLVDVDTWADACEVAAQAPHTAFAAALAALDRRPGALAPMAS